MAFKIITEEIFPKAIHLYFETRYELCSTMLRVQEFYESPYENIRGKYFLLEDYMDVYAKHTGNFNYTADWSGFNVPGNIFNKFFKVFNTNFLSKEINLKEIVDEKKKELNIEKDDDNFYILASYKDEKDFDNSVLKHEIAHALYYLDETYKRKIDDMIRGIYIIEVEKITKALIKKGYCEEVAHDEMQAYFSTSDMLELVKMFENDKLPWEAILKCKQIFNEYYN